MESKMKAMILNQTNSFADQHQPLDFQEVPMPVPQPSEVLIEVSVCGVCHTELDEIEGRTPPPVLPVILGHQVVGRIIEVGNTVTGRRPGERVGVAWIFHACGQCEYCLQGEENLCSEFQATGRDVNGGYAEYMSVPADFVFPIPERFTDAEAAPLLCAGAIGYRSLRLANIQNGQSLGLTGFGASAHLVLLMARHLFPESNIHVFARSEKERRFALELGAFWSGDTTEAPPELLHAIIDTTPVWKPVVEALKHLSPGGRLVINAIRKEPVDQNYLSQLDYPTHLWMEKEIKTVANVARKDVREFLELAAKIPIIPTFQTFPLTQANEALVELREGKIRGAKVLVVKGSFRSFA